MSMKQTMCEFVHGMTCEEVSRFVGSIVRCRDCKYYGHHDCFDGSWCTRMYGWDDGIYDFQNVEPDGFCAWGKRREIK